MRNQVIDRACLVVFSGGQDSTTCLFWAMREFTRVEAVFFDYGQRHASERAAAERIAQEAGVPLKIFRLDFFRQMGGNALLDHETDIDMGGAGLPNTFVPGRNLIFLTCAASFGYTRGIQELATGVCQADYSGYPDCRDGTIRALATSISLGLDTTVKIHTPLMHLTKAASIRLAQDVGALPALAWSHTCYEDAFPPCGLCPACVLRAKGFEEAGVSDPLLERARASNA